MAPEHLKAAAVVLALVSLTLIAFAASEGSAASRQIEESPPKRRGWRGPVTLLCVTMAVGGTLWVVAREEGWSPDRVIWAGGGALIAVLTLLRPWWFWENYRARWLRDTIGDEPTALLYLAVSAACLWVGFFTDGTFGGR